MRVLFTCGGTGGHINPAVAVARVLRERHPDAEILFVGAEDGLESSLIPREGFRLECIRITNFLRSVKPSALIHNAKTVWNIAGALRRADQILHEFKPDVILGTGGYASFSILRQGCRAGIPTIVHESNAIPGLATRMVADHVSAILVPMEECRKNYKNQDRVTVTGTPVRGDFLNMKRSDARDALGLDEKPLVVSYWGSLGAREMNKMIADMFVLESSQEPAEFTHIHATGSYGWRWMPDYVREKGFDPERHPDIRMQEYIYNMPELMAAADLVLCRAGASTIGEIAASGTPAILIPSPNVADNHQEKNARLLESRGAAAVIRETDCSGAVLYEKTRELLSQPQTLERMSSALRGTSIPDSAERICSMLEKFADLMTGEC